MNANGKKITIAAMADLHIHEDSQGTYRDIFTQISKEADFLVLGGDLTDHGLPKEAQILAQELTSCTIPIVGVLGNHDFENNKERDIIQILRDNKIHILDGELFEIEDVGFAGTKGFGGGYADHKLEPWGESAIKQFVYEGVNESLNLETALSRLHTKYKVVVLHYSPIRQTIEGESSEIYAFLGSSRLAEPIDNYNVSVVFHGHAHYGTHQGKTEKGIPVFNVSIPLLRTEKPAKDYFLFTLS